MNPDKPLDPCPCKKWQNGIRFSALVGHNLNCQHFAIAAEKHIETLIKRALKAEEAAPVPQAPPVRALDEAFALGFEMAAGPTPGAQPSPIPCISCKSMVPVTLAQGDMVCTWGVLIASYEEETPRKGGKMC